MVDDTASRAFLHPYLDLLDEVDHLVALLDLFLLIADNST
jgi:hypothetical protein